MTDVERIKRNLIDNLKLYGYPADQAEVQIDCLIEAAAAADPPTVVIAYGSERVAGLTYVKRYVDGVGVETIMSFSSTARADSIVNALNKAHAEGRSSGGAELMSRFDQDAANKSPYSQGWRGAGKYLTRYQP